MMRWILGMALAAGTLPVIAAGQKVPTFDDYAIVVSRNVFDATRQPYREPVKPPPVEHRDPPEPPRATHYMTLAGVLLADNRAVALFVEDGNCHNVTVGGELGQLTVEAVDSSGVRIKTGDKELTVAVGERLSDGGRDEWTVVGRASQAPSVQAVETERKAASRAELLRQMMERRKRELEK